jgi:hypothetical protein
MLTLEGLTSEIVDRWEVNLEYAKSAPGRLV